MLACQNSTIQLRFMEHGIKYKFIIFHIAHIAQWQEELFIEPTATGFGLSIDFLKFSFQNIILSQNGTCAFWALTLFAIAAVWQSELWSHAVMTFHFCGYHHSPHQEYMGYLNLVYMCFTLCMDGQLNMHRKTSAPEFFEKKKLEKKVEIEERKLSELYFCHAPVRVCVRILETSFK